MSRVGKTPIVVPTEVDVSLDGTKISVKGKLVNYLTVFLRR